MCLLTVFCCSYLRARVRVRLVCWLYAPVGLLVVRACWLAVRVYRAGLVVRACFGLAVRVHRAWLVAASVFCRASGCFVRVPA